MIADVFLEYYLFNATVFEDELTEINISLMTSELIL
jgi:hypothetical protein